MSKILTQRIEYIFDYDPNLKPDTRTHTDLIDVDALPRFLLALDRTGEASERRDAGDRLLMWKRSERWPIARSDRWDACEEAIRVRCEALELLEPLEQPLALHDKARGHLPVGGDLNYVKSCDVCLLHKLV